MDSLIDKPISNSNLVFREELDGWALLFDPDSGKVFGLDQVGVYIWKLLDGIHTVEEIISEVRNSFEDVPDSLDQDTVEFLEKLKNIGFIENMVS